MGCLDPQGLARVFHASSVEERSAIESHLDSCSQCRSLVAAYARLEDDGDDTVSGVTRLADTVPSQPTPALDGLQDVVGERYRLERVIGEGGMGVVWAALDLTTGRAVAIKTLKIATGDLFKRFEREARVGAEIGHPNVVEIRAAFTMPDGAPAIVMDLLDGRSLATELDMRGTLSVEHTVSIMKPLLSAVRAAHAKGIVHRDLKPGNVFLASEDPSLPPVVMLLDFGLAKVVATDERAAEKLTRTGALLGTPHYMAPEQLTGETAGPPADVWALGVIAFECLTGRRPLAGKNLAQLVKNVSIGNVATLPDSPIASIVNHMLTIDPAARPTVAETQARFEITV